jgi:hypothetical protein
MKTKIKIKNDTGIFFFMIFPPGNMIFLLKNMIFLLDKMIFYPPDKMILCAPVV